MRSGLRYGVAASAVVVVGVGLALGIALSRSGRAPAKKLRSQWSQYVTLRD